MILTIISVIAILFPAEAIVNPLGPTVIKDFSNCVTELMEYNFKKAGLLVFADTNNVSSSVANIRIELLRYIHSKPIYSVEMKSPRGDPAICQQNKEDLIVKHIDKFEPRPNGEYYIVVIDNYNDFTKVASRIVRSRAWNPLAKFIILLFQFASSNKSIEILIENMFTCLFRYNVINIVVVVPHVNNIRNANVYSWRPYDPPKYCGYFNETAKNRLILENTCEKGIVKFEKCIYLDRIPDNMTGCGLHILALEKQPFISANPLDPNIDKHFINELALRYGFEISFQVLTTVRGERVNREWDGGLKELAAKKGHLLLGGIFSDFDVHEDFECSDFYFSDSHTWVAPKSVPSHPWVALFIIFHKLVWCCAIAGFLLCVIAWKTFGILCTDSPYHQTFRHTSMNAWISMLGFCAYARPVQQSLRIFYVFFNLYCILFLTCYQTKLIDVLKNPSYEDQIDTVQKIFASDLQFGGSEELRDVFQNSSDPFDYLLGEKWVNVPNISKALIDIALYRNFTVLCSRLELAHLSAIIPELSDSSGKPMYYTFDMDMFSAPIEMVARRGFAFMNKFSKTLEIYTQMGVGSATRRSFIELTRLRRAHLLRSSYQEEAQKPLSMQHLEGGFLALIVGYVSGTLTLLLEIIANSEYVKNKISDIRLWWSHRSERLFPFIF